MARILSFADPCHRTRHLLPWYAVGSLDEADRARVDAHLVSCAAFRAELASERSLHAEIAALPVDVENGWAALRERVARRERRPRFVLGVAAALQGAGGDWSLAAPWLKWSLAGQFALLLGALGVLALPRTAPASYHALGLSTASRTGDIVVVFRPDITEARLRGLLEASGARVVDGPTSTDAYLLFTPLSQRPSALAQLRGAREVTLAEPVDAQGSP
jgi:anti-sigma factor RsiW